MPPDEQPHLVNMPFNPQKAQQEVFSRAMAVYTERRHEHGDLWKQFGWEDLIFHIRNKSSRLSRLLDLRLNGAHPDPKQALDSAYDLINYCAFFIRMVEDGEGTQR